MILLQASERESEREKAKRKVNERSEWTDVCQKYFNKVETCLFYEFHAKAGSLWTRSGNAP